MIISLICNFNNMALTTCIIRVTVYCVLKVYSCTVKRLVQFYPRTLNPSRIYTAAILKIVETGAICFHIQLFIILFHALAL